MLRLLAVALPVIAAGCATASLEDNFPTELAPSGTEDRAEPSDLASTEPAPAERATAPVSEAQNREADGYINLNVPAYAATEQISAEEKAASVEELRAARQATQGGGPAAPASDAQRLRQLSRTHADEALREIEGE